ncbi:MAG TPA: hypothetical protein VFP80_12385 [Thermoanaerobaculia bacterium]|nr:hypothetical protein [Thermoanaerobaculia bacterium]
MSRGVQKSASGTLPSLNKITLRKLAVQKVRKEGPINGPTGGYPCNTDATCTGTWCCYSYTVTG